MPNSSMGASRLAQVIFQETIIVLAREVRAETPNLIEPTSHSIVHRAKELIHWPQETLIEPLRSIFDAVHLQDKPENDTKNYWQPQPIADTEPPVPYPVIDPPNITAYKAELKVAIENLSADDWQNLTLLSLFIEKYGSCLSFGATNVSLHDFARTTAAIAAALVPAPDGQLRLIAGDLSGIQKFIYNISSDGALKSLRARSFLIELIAIEIVQQLLEKLHIPTSSVIYAGGGKVYILAAATDEVVSAIAAVQNSFNDWLIANYQGKLFLAMAAVDFPQTDIGGSAFVKHWTAVTNKLSEQKNRKFASPSQVQTLLAVSTSHDPCKVCHRDDLADLQPLNPEEPDSVAACITCRSMFQLGTQLFKSKLIVRSAARPRAQEKYATFDENDSYPRYVTFGFADRPIYYTVFGRYEADVPAALKIAKAASPLSILAIDNWRLEDYREPLVQPLLLGNYYQFDGITEDVGADAFITAEELAKKAMGIDRVGYLRMDVDSLGQIFAKGLTDRSLPQIAALSRQMNYFFKVYLNSLAMERQQNLLGSFQTLAPRDRPDLLFVYTGGDDIFISGAWDQIAEFACDIYQSFRAYTGNNPSITISGGISINTIKHPLYRAAAEAGQAEERAKGNDRDSLDLFGQTFKWSHWLGEPGESRDSKYLKDEDPLTTNIVSLVKKLLDPEIGYSRAFIRNLLILADLRDQKIQDLKQDDPMRQALTYYLHLPKLEYAVARLPKRIRDHPTFKEVHHALRNPRTSPYFRAIATWIELLNRNNKNTNHDRDQ